MTRLVTFTNLFPSSVLPTHGTFVCERMQRVAAAGGFAWQVVAPVPAPPWFLRTAEYRRWAKVPRQERFAGVEVQHPRYRHWPGLSLRRQARAMANGARAALRQIAAQGPFVLDAHYLWPDGVAAAQLAREFGVPFTLTARGSDLNVLAGDAVVAAGITEAAGRAFACCAVSAALCDRFAEVTGLPRERVLEVRNGVDLERFRPGDAAAARRALALPATGRLVLGVGRLVAGKGFAAAARALAALPADVRLVLVGDGPERARIAAAGGDRVILLGAQPAARVALANQAADVFVLPSHREGWPNVVTEALASGLPVVATRVGGIPEMLGDPPAAALGALVPPGDDAALAQALAAVLARPADRDAVRGHAARYGWEQPVATLVDIFRRASRGTP